LPRENHREQLLRGAIACLRDRGYARTTARDIAAASGSNLGSIGYHFGSKEALLNEAIREGFAEWTSQLAGIAFAEEGATPIERARASWVALTESFAGHRPLIVAFVEALGQSVRSDELRSQLADIYEESRAALARLVEASLGATDVAEDQLRAVATFMIAVCDGLMLQWLVDPKRAPSGAEVTAGLEAALPLGLVQDPLGSHHP
jgi:AcrR family transcriptional regulator